MLLRSRMPAIWLALIYSAAAPAQTPGASGARQPAQELESITISASPLGLDKDAMAAPADVLDGSALVLGREGTLGSTLSALPGVNADTFGAGASRPVIRGQAAPRVQVLSDGSSLMDASGVSPDHAITSEPMLAERIEVLRGPATLLYGGGAIGGVVNVLDNKIPTAVPKHGPEGFAEVKGTTGSSERAAAFGLTAGSGNIAVHVEGLKRRSDEYRVPNWSSSTLKGSQSESATGSVGISWIGDRGYIGVAYTGTQSEYGLVGHNHEYESCHPHGSRLHCGGHGEDDEHGHDHEEHGADEAAPYVKLKNKRVDLRGEYRQPFAGIKKISMRAGLTDYRHEEIEQGVVATTFKNRGYDARLEAEHEPIAGWRGVLGVQTARSNFSALGEESFMPETVTQSEGVFLLEEYKLDDWRFELGARQDWQSIRPDNAQPRFSMSATSVSGAAVWDFTPGYALALSLARSQRLPNAQELYADGIHLATNTYEQGSVDLGKETSRNIDLSLRKTAGDARFSLSVFHNRVKDYIYAQTLDQFEDFRLIRYAQHDAEFTGGEAQASYRLNRHFTVGVFGDLVYGRLTGGQGDLPRIPAARAGVRGKWLWQNWAADVEVYRAFRQSQIADYETSTPGYNMVNAGISYDGRWGASNYTVYARVSNLFDQLALNHASFVANAAPLPGRRVTVGVRMEY